MKTTVRAGPDILDRMVRAVERVRERLRRTAAALEKAGVPYAVIGGNCVAAWVARVDEAAVRNTQDVDILLNRGDLPAAKAALEAVGFVFRHAAGIDMFLDGPGAKARDAVHVIYAGERVKAADALPTVELGDTERSADDAFEHLTLHDIVRMKLTSYRLKDRVHLQDFLGVGLIDEAWPARYPPPLAERLQAILDDPEG